VRNHLAVEESRTFLVVFVSGEDPETNAPYHSPISANLSTKTICEPANRTPQGGQVSLNLAVSGPPGMRVLSRLIPGAVSALGIVEPIVKDEDMNFDATGNLNTCHQVESLTPTACHPQF